MTENRCGNCLASVHQCELCQTTRQALNAANALIGVAADEAKELQDKLDVAKERVRVLEAALRPFVEGTRVWSSDSYDDKGHHAHTARRVSAEDYEQARAVLATTEKAQ